MTLKKHDIVLQVKEMGYTQEQSAEIVESLLPIIKSSLENGEDVLVSGFGKFAVKKKSQRKGRNPATGEDMYLDATERHDGYIYLNLPYYVSVYGAWV